MPHPSTPARLTAADLARVARRLPPEPEFAAMALVDLIVGSDRRDADVATAELLRRCGLPLVQADGPVVAVPDDLVIASHPTYVELVPDLTRAVRNGCAYEPEQLTGLLQDLIESEAPVPGALLVEVLGHWGKHPDDPPAARSAGAAVRALAASRGQVLYADAPRVRLDPLQSALVLAHLSGLAYDCTTPPKAEPLRLATGTAGSGLSGKCGALKKILDQISLPYKLGRAPGKGLWNAFDHALDGVPQKAWDDAKWAAARAFSNKWADKLKNFVESGASEAALNLVKLAKMAFTSMLYAQAFSIDVASAEGTVGHYRPKDDHPEHDRTTDFHLTATVRFNPTIPGTRYECYQLAGLNVPPSHVLPAKKPDGTPSDWRVLWQFHAREFPWLVDALGPVDADLPKIRVGHHGAPLDTDGTATLHLYPRREANPGAGLIQTVHVDLEADLYTKAGAPELSDLLGLGAGPEAGATAVGVKILAFFISNALLPKASMTFAIGRHTPGVYTIKGSSPHFTLLMANLPVFVDLYSCNGLRGPWKGRGGADIDANAWTDALSALTGQPEVGDHTSVNEQISFELDPESLGPQVRPITDWLDLQVTLLEPPASGRRTGAILGFTDFLVKGNSLEAAARILGQSVSYPVVGTARDPRCPARDPGEDPFDDDKHGKQ